jgi:hypothetical protein
MVVWNMSIHIAKIQQILWLYKLHNRAERKVNWLSKIWFVCFCFRSHVFVFVRKQYRIIYFAFGWHARVRASLQKFVWAKFVNANLQKARTGCIINPLYRLFYYITWNWSYFIKNHLNVAENYSNQAQRFVYFTIWWTICCSFPLLCTVQWFWLIYVLWVFGFG